MKSKLTTRLILSLTILLAAIAAKAQENFSLKSATATIEGTSSVHDWKSAITDLQYKGLFEIKSGVLKSVKSTEIKILVEGIKST